MTNPTNFSNSEIVPSHHPSFQIGERQQFDFSWNFLKLGTADLMIVKWDTLDRKPMLEIKAVVRSNPLIFLINVQDDYEAWIDPTTGICRRFGFHMNSSGVDLTGIWDYQYSTCGYESRTVVGDGYIFGIRQRLPKAVTDGLSLIYHLRYCALTDAKTEFTFVLDDEFHSGQMIPVGISRVFSLGNQKREGLEWQGIMNCRGIVGLSGNFLAWFSKTPQPYLLKAEAKIFLGSVEITLKEISP
jgi:hypothetical protein